MVEAQLGVGLVPEACAARYVASGNVVALPLDEAWALRQWNICVQDSPTLPAPVRLLLKHLTNREGRQPLPTARSVADGDVGFPKNDFGPTIPAPISPAR
jgi:DNA-binding transcriptional LysR family regulator